MSLDRFQHVLEWVRRSRPEATMADLEDPSLSVAKYLQPDLVAYRCLVQAERKPIGARPIGRTPGFGPGDEGSTPSPRTIEAP